MTLPCSDADLSHKGKIVKNKFTGFFGVRTDAIENSCAKSRFPAVQDRSFLFSTIVGSNAGT